MPSPIPLDSATPLALDMFLASVPCGFPSPAEDYSKSRIDLNSFLYLNRDASYIFRVASYSMQNIGIYEGDCLIVDSSIDAEHGSIVLAAVGFEYTVKELYNKAGEIRLIPHHPDFEPICFKDEMELSIFGVVTWNLHQLRPQKFMAKKNPTA